MEKVNWIKVKNEYINGDISYRRLAEKHNTSFNTLKDRAVKEKWKESKDRQHNNITEKTQQKAAEKISERESTLLVNISDLNFELFKLFKEKISQKKFRETIEARDIKSLTGALKDIQDIQTGISGGGKNTETNKLDIIVKELLNKD